MAKLMFSGGRNTRSTSTSIHEEECSAGENFDLALGRTAFKMRDAFSLAGTAPNAGEIRGYAQLEKADGTISTLIQAGTNVYEWDGASSFTSVGTVNANAKSRGPLTANWTLTDKVLITDINKAEVVKEWDGTTFQSMTTNLGASFYAKYCFVTNDRAFFGNVKSGVTDLPHVLIGSQIEDNETLTTANKPSSALAVDAPFYVIMPDLKPLNGLLPAFGQTIMSTKVGSIWKLTGTTAKDFAIDSLYRGSASDGDEALVDIGNDVVIARAGVIDLLSSTDRFGDVDTDDITNPIYPDIQSVASWKVVYDQERQKIYCFPTGNSEVHVLYKDLIPRYQSEGISPWSKWTTKHPIAFQPATVFSIKSPVTGVQATYMGDSSGNIYEFDQGQVPDHDNNTIKAFRESQMYSIDDIEAPEGWVEYLKNSASYDITLTFQWFGEQTWDDISIISVPALTIGAVYGGSYYYGGNAYYGSQFSSRYTRQQWAAAGVGDGFQIRLSVESATGFSIGSVEVKAKELKTFTLAQ